MSLDVRIKSKHNSRNCFTPIYNYYSINGEKFNIFWLGITFIGWHLLAALTCGISELFLAPYIQATNAEVYSLLRDKAHQTGISDFNELPGFFLA